jgi:hypothetical protein
LGAGWGWGGGGGGGGGGGVGVGAGVGVAVAVAVAVAVGPLGGNPAPPLRGVTWIAIEVASLAGLGLGRVLLGGRSFQRGERTDRP